MWLILFFVFQSWDRNTNKITISRQGVGMVQFLPLIQGLINTIAIAGVNFALGMHKIMSFLCHFY